MSLEAIKSSLAEASKETVKSIKYGLKTAQEVRLKQGEFENTPFQERLFIYAFSMGITTFLIVDSPLLIPIMAALKNFRSRRSRPAPQ